MDDAKIIALYEARDESAIAETQQKYGGYCRYIAERILACKQDPEECVNDAYHKVWNTIPPQKPESLASYVGMLTRQLSLNRYKENHRQKRGAGVVPLILDELQECIADKGDMPSVDDIALRDAMNAFLAKLPQRTRMVFMRRYWYADEVSTIAADYGMSESHVGVLLYRTRKKLKEHLEKEEIYV